MMNNKQRFEQFNSSPHKVWDDKLTWKGIDGRFPKNEINIKEFLKTSDFNMASIESMDCVDNFYAYVKSLSKKYFDWAKDIRHPTDKENKIDLESKKTIYETQLTNFFVGVMGEIFFNCFLTNIKQLAIDREIYHINNVAPCMSRGDFGIDATCNLAIDGLDREAVIQIKFWNRFSKFKLNTSIAQAAYAQGCAENIIDQKDDKNTIICWLGNDMNVSNMLKSNKAMYKHLVFVDSKVLDLQNIKDVHFWKDYLPDYIRNFVLGD